MMFKYMPIGTKVIGVNFSEEFEFLNGKIGTIVDGMSDMSNGIGYVEVKYDFKHDLFNSESHAIQSYKDCTRCFYGKGSKIGGYPNEDWDNLELLSLWAIKELL